MDISRRSFIRSFGFTIAAVSCPVDLSGTKIIKLEKRYAPGEFIYFSYGPSDPIKLIDNGEFLHYQDTIAWDDKMDRIRLFKDIVVCSYKQLTYVAFKDYVASIFDFCVAIDSCFESTNIILNALDVTHFRTVHRWAADAFVRSPNFNVWRLHHKKFFVNSKYKDSEDIKTHKDYIRNPENFKEYQFTSEENEMIENLVTDPSHWLYPFLKEAGELKPVNGEYRIY